MDRIKTLAIISIFGLLSFNTLATDTVTVSPPNWWVGMAQPEVELMIHATDIASVSSQGNSAVSVSDPNVVVTKVARQDSNNYLFVTLDVSLAKAGGIQITLHGDSQRVIQYSLLPRQQNSAQRQGFTPTDTIYLIAPDRFANGNSTNDNVEGYSDKVNRTFKGGRHGGDIQGMIDRLDYIADMGFTQIWTMPLLENAMDSYSYHGYSTTDYYRIDPRYGSNELYRQLSKEASERGVGIIMDVILNHIGSNHPWMQDKPANDWINHQTFVPTTHRRETLHDPHAIKSDQVAFSDGWFVPTMPDLNQRNPHLATYLIQNAIWWVEYADLSGLRVDTYSYSDKTFLSHWTQRLMQEYPNLNIVGEEWSVNPLITSYWQAGTKRHDNYVSALPSVMDFPLQTALIQALKEQETWGTGLVKLYDTMASDFVYGDPYNLVVFADNHDMSRVFSQLNEDTALWDMAMTYVLTTRGIPQIFYGSEILMKNPGTDDHGIIRSDFPGGWKGDIVDGFTGDGLSSQQKSAQQRVRQLMSLRKQYPQLFSGEFYHYTPQDGVYVYFRTQTPDAINQANQQSTFKEPTTNEPDAQYPPTKLMVVLNKNKHSVELDLSRFNAILDGHGSISALAEDDSALLPSTLTIPAYAPSVWILN